MRAIRPHVVLGALLVGACCATPSLATTRPPRIRELTLETIEP